MIKAVIFDMDGLILDTEKLLVKYWCQAANKAGFPMQREHALNIRSLARKFAIPYLQGIFGEEFDYVKIRSRRMELMKQHISEHGLETKPGIAELLDYLDSKGIPAAIATATDIQRTEDYKNGSYALAGGVVDPLPEDAPQFVKDYHSYYKTRRGYHPRSLNSGSGWNVTSSLPFINMPILQYSSEIRSAVLLVHGEKAHSRYFSEGAYEKLTGDNKELMIIPGANHVDLYDSPTAIPFEKLKSFFEEYLK